MMKIKKPKYIVNTKPKSIGLGHFTWYTFKFFTHREMIEFGTLNPQYEVDSIKGGIYGN